jgi:hypothetical protein
MPFLVYNERAKLVANALDRASTGCFITGVVGPTGTLMLNHTDIPKESFVVVLVLWVLAAVVLHIEARRWIDTLLESD